MKVLVLFEMSGRVRDAFIARGHTAISCDILPSESDKGEHSTLHWWEFLERYPVWDLMIAHPPCTFLSNAGQKWYYHPDDWGKPPEERSGRPHPDYPHRRADQQEAIKVLETLWTWQRIPKRVIENPRGVVPSISKIMGPPTQTVQPWWFGEPETKALCLWEHDVPLLVPDRPKPKIIKQSTWLMAPGANRAIDRSRTFLPVARAFAEQWG
jgi:hypothetical protein